MKRLFSIAYACLIFFSCNNIETEKQPVEDVIKNAPGEYIKAYSQLIQSFPDSTGLRLKYALALDSMNMHKEALLQIDTLISKDSANYDLLYIQGQIAEDAKDTLLALKSYAKAAAVYESPDVLLALANLYAEMKNSRAIVLCSRVKALGLGRSVDASCAFITGIYYARIRKGDEAVKYFDECIANNYTYLEAYIEKGLVYFDARQYDKALKIFRFASTVNNLYADAYYYMARCYEEMNIKDSAVLRFKQSLQLDPNLDEARKHLKLLGEE